MNFKYTFYIFLFSVLFSACSKKKITTNENSEAVELPDGSIVFLSQYSELEYLEAFNQRRVAISGECYFSIESSNKSFIVEGHLGEVEVLGTEFSMKSNTEQLEVQVAEGTVAFKVEGQSENISSGRMASFENGDDSIETGKASINFNRWMAKLRIELKRLDKDLDNEVMRLEDKLLEKAKEIEKEAGKVERKLNEAGKQIEKSIKDIAND
ncbi:FecR domain-containing protein [uncultured Marivirga sp.]|uniref:FecR domain-containing protein n=1 Tax=uncultured Marivirga sp. TaxID=1123707 RepID=UPI0030EB7F94